MNNKKAIKSLKEFAYTIHGTLSAGEAEIVLNLIEKLQKENEELKALDLSNSKIIANMSTRHFQDREKIRKSIPVQKVKDKIEELKKKVEELTDDKGYWGGSDLLEQIKVLQELLEKEK